MKFRYIFEKWSEIKGTNNLTKEHLISVKNRNSDFLIDTENGTYYDAESNEWKEIEES
jgi:hypothetical protein